MRRSKSSSYKIIQNLIAQPRRTLVSILVGNEMVNISFSVIFAAVVISVFRGKVSEAFLPFLPVFLALPVILLMGEIIPKTVAIRAPDRIASINAYPIELFAKFIYPLRFMLRLVVDILARPFLGSKGKQDTIIDEDYFKTFVEIGREEGVLDEIEKDMIDRVLDLDDILVEKIMQPLSRVASVPENIKYKRLMSFIRRERYSRIPVHDPEDEYRIKGVLRIKELLNHTQRETADFGVFLREIIQKPLFITARSRIIDVLRTFQNNKKHMGIVVDEIGKMKGLVTLEDVLEELFGEIVDEFDIEEGYYTRLDEANHKFDLRIGIERFSEIVDHELDTTGSRTLGQVLAKNLEHKPGAGDIIVKGPLRITIREEKGRLFAIVYGQGR